MKTSHYWLAGLAYMLGAWFWPQFIVFRPGAWLLGQLGLVKVASGQPSGVTQFVTATGKSVKAADDIVLGTPNTQGTTDGGQTWADSARLQTTS